jgi:hypothetical protein
MAVANSKRICRHRNFTNVYAWAKSMNDRAINLWQIQHRGLDLLDTFMLGYCEWFNQCYAQSSSPFQGTS